MSGRMTGSDVKTATTTSTATGGVSLVSGRSRLKGFVVSGGGSDGTVTFRDGSASGSTLLIVPCNTNVTETLTIPDQGVMFESGIHATLANLDRVTVFHS